MDGADGVQLSAVKKALADAGESVLLVLLFCSLLGEANGVQLSAVKKALADAGESVMLVLVFCSVL